MKCRFKLEKLTVFVFSMFVCGVVYSQSITVEAGNLKQEIEFMGADFERSQNFVQNATNTNEIIDWVFRDVNFNLARVAYDKIQKTENEKYEIEANNIGASGTYVQWQLRNGATEEIVEWSFGEGENGNGTYFIQNIASNTNLQSTSDKTDDDTGNRVFSRPARSCGGSWCKWELTENENYPGYYNIRSVGQNKYLQCTSDPSANTGLFVKAVDVNTINENDENSLWKLSLKNNSNSIVFIDNKGFDKRLRYTDIDEVVENMAFYNNAIKTMQAIKSANSNVKFLATMRSDYHGYKSGNWNNLPEYIYQYSCVETNDAGNCIKTIGNKSFNANSYGVFLADYLELMHNNGVTIDYLATAKEWTSVVTPLRSHVAYEKMKLECADRGIPIPEIIGPASWSLSQGVSYIEDVETEGYQNEYHSFSSHNLNNQSELYDDFALAATSVGKKTWNDESSAGGGSRTSGVNPDISLAINTYIDKTVLYKGGLVGECFFEVNSRGVNSETRAIYFKNNTEGKRLRSYYIMKDFANGVVGKKYVESTTSLLEEVHSMAFVKENDFTVVIVNNSEDDINNIPVNFNNFQLDDDIKQITWTNDNNDEGAEVIIKKGNTNTFVTDLKAKSICIYTNQSDELLFSKQINNNTRVRVSSNPVLDEKIHLVIDDDFMKEKLSYSLINSNGQVVLQGDLNYKMEINISNVNKGLYFLKLNSKRINSTLKVLKSNR
ncbi:RICIN domain-containing protein [Wenyingzhuangia sp. 1_MG-2023]|nr:RICIN domain-containing protein [Wenyingzhuangia sp. 1_MG-2023]